MDSIRRLLAVAAIVLSFFPCAFAQELSTVKVRIIDSLTSEPLPDVTVYVSMDGTVKGAYYTMTGDDGIASISGVPSGRYVLVASLMGFFTKNIPVTVKSPATDAGTLRMREDMQLLAEAVVEAVGNPVVVKKDTVEYTAASFKTTDNDMLEDLLKKMPGMEVDSDGNITANGETITKIKIDGKEFFLDDPQLASKNIPAKIIEKVRLVEEKSEQAKFTGIDDGEEETIIDLSIKSGMLDAWFGNVTGGGGHDLLTSEHEGRYQGSAMVGRFTDKSQISFIANGNNTNNRGFQDMAGEMMQSMRSAGGGGGMRGMPGMGPGMFGGNIGITTSWMAGVNANTYLQNDDEKELGGNYLYSGSDRNVVENSVRTTFLDDTQSLITRNNSEGMTFNDGHRAGLELDYKFNDNTSIFFRPSFMYGRGRFDETTSYSSDNSVTGKVNDGYSEAAGDNRSWRTRGMFLLRQRIGKAKGRTVSLFMNYNLSNSFLNGTNYSVTNSYEDNTQTGSTVVDQRYNQKDETYSVSANLTYTEPLGKNYFLMASYRYSWNRNESEKLTYDVPTGNLDTDYSNRMSNTFMNHNMQLNFMKQEEKYNIQVGFSAQPATTETLATLGAERDTSYTVWNFAPSARFDYRFSDNNFIRITYRGRTEEPSINQLMPVPDNSDPLYVSLGNPSLNPEFSHRIRADYRYTNMKNFASLNVRMRFDYVKDDIINANWYDAAGVQYTVPVNSAKPTFSGNMMLMFNTPLGRSTSKFSMMSFTRLSMSSNLTYTAEGTDATTFEEVRDYLIGGRTTSLTAMENLTFVYRDKWVEARLGARASYQKAWYEISSQARSDTWNNAVFADVTATLPWGMEIRTDGRYNYYIGYDAGYGEPSFTWNAEISQLFFKKKMTLRFKVYDILNQAKNNYRINSDNYVQDVYNNTLGQYFIISLTYRFGNFDNMAKGRRPGPPHR